jgi:serine/threonine-protein kinase
MEGKILGNRYELLEKIGGGGMAQVYRAKCKLLNRHVAVKILRNDFSSDDEFIRRFSIEAQSAASLSHPNIVSIYDVGFEGDTHYIVMEYVDGITLKDYLVRKGNIDWKEAVSISRQICSAIDHAHKNQIVHRDIKPHNIMYNSDGIIKVTDFGIARAASFSTITMVGSTIGSVHYFSPEQARGGYTDEKSDIYSMGIVLYELVTGKLPFDGETSVAIALKHIQTEPDEPIKINDNIPSGLNDIILNAIKKEQTLRYQTASEFLHDLNNVLTEPASDYKKPDPIDENSTKRMPAINVKIPSTKEDRLNKPINAEKTPQERKKDRITIILASLSGLIIVPIIAFITIKLLIPLFFPVSSVEYSFEDFKGSYYPQTKDKLTAIGIEVREVRQFDNQIPKDIVISQNRNAGDKVKIDKFKTSIELVVSNGPARVKIPDVRSFDIRRAETTFRDLGLKADLQEEFSDTVAKEIVIRTEPVQDTEIPPSSTVKIYFSKGPEEKITMVPYLIGKTRDEALKLLADAKLAVGNLTPDNSTNISDKVIKQEPDANSKVKEGTQINMTFDTVTVSSSGRISVRETITLLEPHNYSDNIQVKVELVPDSTNITEIAINEYKKKSDFPLPITLMIPQNGKTIIRVYLDNKLYMEY